MTCVDFDFGVFFFPEAYTDIVHSNQEKEKKIDLFSKFQLQPK